MNPALVLTYKSSLRKKLRLSLKRIAGSRRLKKSRKISQRLIQSPFFKKAQNILIYAALPSEVETRELILKTLKTKKSVFVPFIHPKRKKIEIYKIKNWSKDLRKGTYGILEPKSLPHRKGDVKQLDLVIVPGLGFDRKGGRLGRGAGYFDRFLKKAKRARKIGLAFREQLVRKIPMEKHDIPMNEVISDL